MPKPIMIKWDLFQATVNVAKSFSVNNQTLSRGSGKFFHYLFLCNSRPQKIGDKIYFNLISKFSNHH